MNEQTKVKRLVKLSSEVKNIAVSTSRDNANVGNNFSAKLLQIASASNKTVQSMEIPEEFVESHESGRTHMHDLDSYNLTTNCLNIDTGSVLKKGFNTGYGTINTPKRIESAASLSCIVLQSTQNDMFGGQGHYNFDNDMADFAVTTEQELLEDEMESCCDYGEKSTSDVVFEDIPTYMQSRIKKRVAKKLEKAVRQGCQTTVYNLNSMHSRAGSQVPFSSINIGIPKNKYAALVCQLLLEEYNKGLGKGEQPVFPNIIFRVKEGVNRNPGDPYYYLYQLACKVAANRMNPMFVNCDSSFDKPFYDNGIMPTRMGCRTRIGEDVNGEDTPCARGNIAPISMNLPQIAIEAVIKAGEEGLIEVEDIIRNFNEELDKTLEMSERQLLHRYDTLKQLKGKDLPFVIGENLMVGAEEVGPNDSIEPILKHGTWSIGFIGLAETLTCMIGNHHGETKEAWDLGYAIVSRIRKFCDSIKEKHSLNFTCYATPAEGLSGRFTAIDIERYGEIGGVTDKDFYTNSFHIPVDQSISFKKKLDLEAPFHELCNAGHISYIELDTAPVDDPDVVERIITYAFSNTNAGYIGINFGIKYCKDCGQNHIKGNLCPNDGSSNLQGIHRVTGYLSLDERFGKGKDAEVKLRRAHS